jgi:hypothetical protein
VSREKFVKARDMYVNEKKEPFLDSAKPLVGAYTECGADWAERFLLKEDEDVKALIEATINATNYIADGQPSKAINELRIARERIKQRIKELG